MKTIPVTKARQDLFNIINDTIAHDEPIQITAKTGNAIIISEVEWKGLMETLHLLSIPGMKEKLTEGKNTPVADCISLEEIQWDNIE